MPFFHGAPQEPGVMLAVHSQTGEQRLLWSVGTTDWRTWREPLPGCDERAN
jgi:hypothetical protein